MDRSAKRALLLIAATALVGAATGDDLIGAARWAPPARRAHAAAFEPTECVSPAAKMAQGHAVTIGRAAFRAPLLLGGQAARAGLSCNACHRSGRDNPDFVFAGLSSVPGTADVTSSFMSSHRGDGQFNPKPIPDLSGPRALLRVSQDPANGALERFVRGLIVEEFDGPEPPRAVLEGLAAYVRALRPGDCPAASEQRVSLDSHLTEVHHAAAAASERLTAGDRPSARLLISAARSMLGSIDERLPAASLHAADRELAAIQREIADDRATAQPRLSRWIARSESWVGPLRRAARHSPYGNSKLASP